MDWVGADRSPCFVPIGLKIIKGWILEYTLQSKDFVANKKLRIFFSILEVPFGEPSAFIPIIRCGFVPSTQLDLYGLEVPRLDQFLIWASRSKQYGNPEGARKGLALRENHAGRSICIYIYIMKMLWGALIVQFNSGCVFRLDVPHEKK